MNKRKIEVSRKIIFILVFGGLGIFTLVISRAAINDFVSLEVESSTLTAPATKVSDTTASGGEAIRFGATAPPTQFVSQCLQRSGNRITLSGLRKSDYKNYSLPANTVIDATNLVWDGTDSAGNPINWLIGVGSTGPGCWYGAKWTGVWDDTDPAISWSDPYHHAGVLTIKMDDFLVEGIKATNQGDGIRTDVNSANFHIRGIYLTDMHDDCVENDFLHSGIIEDSLFDGCYTGFSADDFTGDLDGSDNTMTIRDNLMYLKPTNTVYHDIGPKPGTGILFKGWWQSPSPNVSLTNNIFRIDSDSGLGAGKLALRPTMNLSNCSNNTIVWTGPGQFPYTYPSCFNITNDISVWNNAVTAWKASHQAIAN